MRTVLVVSVALLSLSAASCNKKSEPATDTASAPASASVAAPASAPPPPAAPAEASANAIARSDIGGQVVRVGEHQVELRLFANGFADAQGAFLDEKSKAKLVVHANAAANAHPLVTLAYEPALGRFAVHGASKAQLTPGPLDIELHLGKAVSKGRLDAAVLLTGPQMGGTLFVAGKHGVELDVRADGRVEALVADASGARINGGAGVELEVKLAGADGQAHAVKLAWDEAKARFAGQVDASVKLAAGPADVLLNGELAARLPTFALRAEAKHGGQVLVAGEYSVELVAKGPAVQAFVFDASAAPIAKGDLALSLRAGAGAFTKLAWDAPNLAYRAKLRAPIDLDVSPILIGIRADAKAFVGASIPTVRADANAKLDAKAKLPTAKVDAKAGAGAKASANIKVPKIEVSKSASASAGSGGASAKAGFSFGAK
ncbi:hypothetical protein [Pendulispora albinea]|uniref:Lipoprotein n=1 Tax=Pendulispora albinea TaxID=2741071 RepID=A0ABZ2M1I3_9BACT